VHARVRNFKCSAPGCKSAFFFDKDEKKHYATVHMRHRPYVCDRCGQSFGKKEHLKNHENRTHLHIKPYGCKVCDVMLASKHNLLSHINTRAHARAVASQGAAGASAVAGLVELAGAGEGRYIHGQGVRQYRRIEDVVMGSAEAERGGPNSNDTFRKS
jgi:Zinc-finger of C2H2 type